MEKVWVLGSKHPKAEASFEWKSPFPNFSNADTLIVNLHSLDKDILSDVMFRNKLYDEARKQVFDMLMTGDKTVIVIMSSQPTDLKWLPIYPIYRRTAPAKLVELPQSVVITDYLKNVETCSYYFHDVNYDYFHAKTNPESDVAENYYFTSDLTPFFNVKSILENGIFNVAKQIIGGAYRAVISWGLESGSYTGKHFSGQTLFLPPSTKKKPEVAIDSLLNSLIGTTYKEPIAPSWDKSIEMPKLPSRLDERRKVEKKIKLLNKQVGEINEEIRNITRLRSLLWADGGHLEVAVKEAFKILGFQEIRKIRAENLEDWVIDFKHLKEFEHAVLEIKSSEKRTSMADLTQCNKWVEDYWLEGEKVKGIFVVNQYRLNDISKNVKEREQFAPNELEYAQKREICILPTNQLFNAVVRKMKTDREPTRAELEKKIAESNGICVLS